MKTKWTVLVALLLALTLTASCALAATANATIVLPETQKITAPFAGVLLPFDLLSGDRVQAGDTLFTVDTTPVYAAQDGTVAAVFAAEGDDAAGTIAHYGALAAIEPDHPLYVAATTAQAYDNAENRYLHAGEMLYLKCGNEKGTGMVTRVTGNEYGVEILTGNFDVNDTVRCFRESSTQSDSETGRGKVARYADTAVAVPAGRVAKVHVKAGDRVRVGDVLFEVVDAAAAKDASPLVTAPQDGVITAMHTLSGAQVYRGQLLCEVGDLARPELRAEVDEIDLSRVHVGDSLTYTLDAYADETFTGTVTAIRPMGQARQNATYFDVRITLPQGKQLLPGMNATVVIP